MALAGAGAGTRPGTGLAPAGPALDLSRHCHCQNLFLVTGAKGLYTGMGGRGIGGTGRDGTGSGPGPHWPGPVWS